MGGHPEIAQLGAEVLRQQATFVDDIGSVDIGQTIAAMRRILASTQGVGLAAPQISVSRCIIIVASRPTSRYPAAPAMQPTVMINPEFQALSNDKERGWEGCLSIPGIRALVPRFKSIEVCYSDESGERRAIKLEGFVARIFQHEFDHLDGLVYLDRVEDNRDIVAESEYFKRIAR